MKVWHQDHDEQFGIVGGILREVCYAAYSRLTGRPVLSVPDQSQRNAEQASYGMPCGEGHRVTTLTAHWGGVLGHTVSRTYPVTCATLSSTPVDTETQDQRDSLPERSPRITTALLKNLLQ